ncbi:MAG: N-acetylmuramoyl-L-alanine amidase family protein [Gemmatimonadaceae bacterium]
MIGALLLALQIGAAMPRSLVVRDAHQRVRVPLVASADGPMLRPESLGDVMELEIRRDPSESSKYTLNVWGTELKLEAGVPFVRIGDDVRPLAIAPRVQNGQLLVPLQLVSDVFPGVVPNARWDADSGQLVLFAFASSKRQNGAARAVASDDAPVGGGMPISAATSRADDRRLPPVPPKRYKRTVIVDAGHGGEDNGMTGPLGGGPRIYEKNITLAVAKKLGDALAQRGVDVVYTRTTDTLIALDDRGRIANRASGNLFISIHVNAANPNWKDPRSSRGFETYFLSEARTEDARRVEQMENAAVRFEQPNDRVESGDPLSYILSDMQQNEHLRESSELAELIQQHLARMHPGPSRGVKQAGFRVLVTAYMPAVLVEIGFGTNPAEAAYISDGAKQTAIASAIADAAMQYLERYESRVKSAAGKGPTR